MAYVGIHRKELMPKISSVRIFLRSWWNWFSYGVWAYDF